VDGQEIYGGDAEMTDAHCSFCGKICGIVMLPEYYLNVLLFCSSSCQDNYRNFKNLFKLHSSFPKIRLVQNRGGRRPGEISDQIPKELLHTSRPEIKYGSTCCKILKTHHEILKKDPERLSTEFIKELSQCECKRKIE
jgi:hypothetical protein